MNPVFVRLLHTKEMFTYLADTINTSGHSHTSEYLTDIAKIFAKAGGREFIMP